MTNHVGQQLGNYRLVRLLGEGGFAEVYLGEHIHLGTEAAIKLLHTRLASDDGETFRAEARTVAHLIHPNIVRILEFGMEGKTPYLVMDYAPHGTLRQKHPKGTSVPLANVVSYTKHIAEALQYAHDQKLIHRDVKPENMLLGRRNEVLLSDFGIALIAQSSRYQSTQNMAGTIAYMAPEQIQGKPRAASDQYALAVVAYEWLSGDRPFHGSFTEVAIQHAVVNPQPLRERIPLSLAVEQVVMRGLTKEPRERFSDVQAFARALEQAFQEKQTPTLPPRQALSPRSPLPTIEVPIAPKQEPIVSAPKRNSQMVSVPPKSAPSQRSKDMALSATSPAQNFCAVFFLILFSTIILGIIGIASGSLTGVVIVMVVIVVIAILISALVGVINLFRTK